MTSAAPQPPLLAAKLKLANGWSIPQIFAGLYSMGRRTSSQTMKLALEAGYRGFDSAQVYQNEREVGTAINNFIASSKGRLSRGDFFFTTKLGTNSPDWDTARLSVTISLEVCTLGYIDLFLLHSPYGGTKARLASWEALEDAVIDGEIHSIGVCNYGVDHIEELMAAGPRIMPVVNQIESHPFNNQSAIREVCAKYGIAVQASVPLTRGKRLSDPTVVRLAESYKCTPAQLMIRWSLQQGMIPCPKSTRKERLWENANVAGFHITDEDMEVLNGLHDKHTTDWDPTEAP